MYFVEYASQGSEAGKPAVPGNATAPVAGRLRVLVAEDNPVNQLLVRTLLQIGGHSCTVVDNGVAAVRAVQEDHFDLVLMDIRMPEMSGLEACRAIRALGERYASLPIFAMTANAEEDEAGNYAAAGMTGYLPKPIDRQRFLALLDAHCRMEEAAC